MSTRHNNKADRERQASTELAHPAESDTTRQVTIEQENAIDLLLLGKSDREVGEAVGVTRQTINHWRNHHPAFIVELNARRAELWQSQADRLRALLVKALDILELDLATKDLAEMTDAERRLRQIAAIHVLRAVGLHKLDMSPKGPITLTEVQVQQSEQESSLRLRALLTAGW